MRLPDGVLKRVRGPLLAVAVAGCSSPAITEAPAPALAPEPMEPIAVVHAAEPNDAVDYDAESEAERLARLDRALSAAEHRREDRIEEVEDAQRPRVIGLGVSSPWGHQWPHGVHPACGRG